jgi:hypothetical protein
MLGFLTRRYDLATEIQTRGPGPREQYEDVWLPLISPHGTNAGGSDLECRLTPVVIRTRMIRAVTHAGHFGQDTIVLRLIEQWAVTFVGLGPFGLHALAFVVSWATVAVYLPLALLRERMDAVLNAKSEEGRRKWFSGWDVYDGAMPGALLHLPSALAVTFWSFSPLLAGIVATASLVAGVVLAVGVYVVLLPWEAKSDG